MVNHGVVEADGAFLQLDLENKQNRSLISAINGASLHINEITVDNAGGKIFVDPTSTLTLNGATVDRGTLSGGGLVVLGASGGVIASDPQPEPPTVLDVTVDVAGGQTLTLDGDGFVLDGTVRLDPATGQTATLELIDTSATGLTLTGAGRVEFASAGKGLILENESQPTPYFDVGPNMTIAAIAGGTGTIGVHLINNGTLAAEGGTLTIAGGGTADLDGDSEGGRLEVMAGGTLVIVDTLGETFDGTATVSGDGVLDLVNNTGWGLGVASVLNLNGGADVLTRAIVTGDATATQVIAGTVNVDGIGAAEIATVIAATAVVNLPDATDQLRITRPTTIAAGATFTGTGQVNNTTAAAMLTLEDGAVVDTRLVNRDELAVGNSPGQATIDRLVQTFSGTLYIEVQTPPVGADPVPGIDHDHVVVTRTATLDGTLDVSHLPDAGPTGDIPLGTEYEVMTYAMRSGMFHTVSGTVVDTGFALAPFFTDTDGDLADDALILRAMVPGDLNGDMRVSVADLSEFALNFNQAPGLYDDSTQTNSWELGDFNTDGAITVADLSLLALNFGFDGTDPANPVPGDGLTFAAAAHMIGLDPAAVPEPAAVALLLAGLPTCWSRFRR